MKHNTKTDVEETRAITIAMSMLNVLPVKHNYIIIMDMLIFAADHNLLPCSTDSGDIVLELNEEQTYSAGSGSQVAFFRHTTTRDTFLSSQLMLYIN